jgi:hypothetical protein
MAMDEGRYKPGKNPKRTLDEFHEKTSYNLYNSLRFNDGGSGRPGR